MYSSRDYTLLLINRVIKDRREAMTVSSQTQYAKYLIYPAHILAPLLIISLNSLIDRRSSLTRLLVVIDIRWTSSSLVTAVCLQIA